MTIFVAEGWSGANPLHALAALGLLRLGHRLCPGIRMGWRQVGGAWRPAYTSVGEVERWLVDCAQALQCLSRLEKSDPTLNRRVRELDTRLKNLHKERKAQEKTLRAEARALGLTKAELAQRQQDACALLDQQTAAIESEYREAQHALQRTNGLGIAHVGDAIGVDADSFRQGGEDALALWFSVQPEGPVACADPSLLVTHWPALASDAIVENGKVVPTPYSFSNGSGGQYLLKDFRACASRVTADRLLSSLKGEIGARVDDATSLNWDPGDQVSHALVWQDPQDREKSTDTAANALAYLGLSLVPAVPRANGLTAVGWHSSGGFVWPVWSPFLPMDLVASLMASVPLRNDDPAEELLARGVREVRFASKVNPDGKRNFFAPSRPLT
jgi:hypothetical protein